MADANPFEDDLGDIDLQPLSPPEGISGGAAGQVGGSIGDIEGAFFGLRRTACPFVVAISPANAARQVPHLLRYKLRRFGPPLLQ